MKGNTDIRVKLGLTQLQLANYLEISRSLLVLYETGRRVLPTAAMVKLANIELFFKQQDAKQNDASLPHEKQQLEKSRDILERLEKEFEYQQLVAERKLEKVRKAYNQKINLLHFSAHVAANKKINKNDEFWAKTMTMEVANGLEKNGLHQQLKLELDLKAIGVMRENIAKLKE